VSVSLLEVKEEEEEVEMRDQPAVKRIRLELPAGVMQ
jgi:hypothetical protein